MLGRGPFPVERRDRLRDECHAYRIGDCAAAFPDRFPQRLPDWCPQHRFLFRVRVQGRGLLHRAQRQAERQEGDMLGHPRQLRPRPHGVEARGWQRLESSLHGEHPPHPVAGGALQLGRPAVSAGARRDLPDRRALLRAEPWRGARDHGRGGAPRRARAPPPPRAAASQGVRRRRSARRSRPRHSAQGGRHRARGPHGLVPGPAVRCREYGLRLPRQRQRA
mmetsp:Transcript_91833/g.256498  ORF Transcript_91833/g.256498 Transcript_91833/m.256498 type:complete len:221 (+) Transcript_91833:213-875(+)